MNSGPQRFLGLALSGAKNSKTTLATLEFYPKEDKLFLLDLIEKIPESESKLGPDHNLIECIREKWMPDTFMGVNVPTQFPACVNCIRKTCPLPVKCTVPDVKWGRERLNRYKIPSTEFTPYTTRSIDLYLKNEIISQLPNSYRFEIDEAFGANKGPLTTRLKFLMRHFPEPDQMIEVLPKLSLAALALQNRWDSRSVRKYRDLDDGAFAREKLLEQITHTFGVFIYEGDQRALVQNLQAFDSFLCAYTALIYKQNQCLPRPKKMPKTIQWCAIPKIPDPGTSSTER